MKKKVKLILICVIFFYGNQSLMAEINPSTNSTISNDSKNRTEITSTSEELSSSTIRTSVCYQCACKNEFVSNSRDNQKPNFVRRDLQPDEKTTTTEEVSSTNPQASFSSSSVLFNSSIVTTSSPSFTSSSNLLPSSIISSAFSSSSLTPTIPNIFSSSSNSTITNNLSSSSNSTIPNIFSSSSTSTIPKNSSSSSFSTIPNIFSSFSTSAIPNIFSSNSSSTIPNNSSLSSSTIITTLSTSTTKITTSSRKLNTDESFTASLIQSLLTKFRIFLVKIIKLTFSQKRSLIVGETNLTYLETELLRSIPNSIFKGYRESNDIFIDANITTEILDDKTDINSFIHDVNKTLIRDEDNFKRVAPSEFTLLIENDFEFKVFRINANGTEEEIDISDSNNSTIANNTQTVSKTTVSTSQNSANHIPYTIEIYFIGMFYFINLILVN